MSRGPGLIVGKSAQRIRSSREEPFRQWDRLFLRNAGGRGKWHDDAELGLTRQYKILRQRVIRCIAHECAAEAALGAEDVRAHSEVRRSVDALVRIGGIVAAVVHKIGREHSDAHGLQKLRNQKNRNDDAVHADPPVGELKQPSQRLAEFLRKLNGGFFALGGESPHVNVLSKSAVYVKLRPSTSRKRG